MSLKQITLRHLYMQREIITTNDGSSTIRLSDSGESYHSAYGAIAESCHIFIRNGLCFALPSLYKNRSIRILEIGLGTGLNLLLSAGEIIDNKKIKLHYTAIELFPVTPEELRRLNYIDILDREELSGLFNDIHSSPWNDDIELLPNLTIKKLNIDILSIPDSEDIGKDFDIIYFDAFSPNIQPELWSSKIFSAIRDRMSENAILVTYSSRGSVKSALREAGFTVTRLKGPEGKRHIVRATIGDRSTSI